MLIKRSAQSSRIIAPFLSIKGTSCFEFAIARSLYLRTMCLKTIGCTFRPTIAWCFTPHPSPCLLLIFPCSPHQKITHICSSGNIFYSVIVSDKHLKHLYNWKYTIRRLNTLFNDNGLPSCCSIVFIHGCNVLQRAFCGYGRLRHTHCSLLDYKRRKLHVHIKLLQLRQPLVPFLINCFKYYFCEYNKSIASPNAQSQLEFGTPNCITLWEKITWKGIEEI